ncbi:DedA family protein [Hazenella coriacea]|uniref:Membrane protein DedA with SNARE-associated domain n=1 Tax=Hazenella coriacea TaxID=1179467 RepID=A0A4R3LBB1_9BACL|nr:VTT domain-containing protein [Hazenella coriacea]TCS94806.1 membrane protein DedA with SNARE-associated domain [Hazenella coriacea]
MLTEALDFLGSFGIWGLLLATAIEASALPFPGALFVLIYGYIFQANPWNLVLIGAANSVVYTIFSMIPYYIGSRIEQFTKKKLDEKKIEKAQKWFKKYGEWSIALSRPTSLGNYVSFISGMSQIKPWRFLFFTFIGVFPWNTLLLFVGHLGTLDSVQNFLTMSSRIGYILFGVIAIALVIWLIVKKSKQKQESQHHCEKG